MIMEDNANDVVRTTSKNVPPEILGGKGSVETLKSETESNDAATTSPASGISKARRIVIVIGLCMAIFLTALDQVTIS